MVEAAFLLPVMLLLIGLMAQPAILLYNKAVMDAAAAEGCRMLATNASDDAAARAFVVRRLGAVPNVEAFHVGGRLGWDVKLQGSGNPGGASLSIVNKVRPLPLLGVTAALAGSKVSDGYIEQRSSAESRLWPQWASGSSPAGLQGGWK